MKKIENSRITFLVNREKTTIEITDNNASVTIVRVELTPEQLSDALSRLAYTECTCHVGDLNKVGKKMEVNSIIFEVDDKINRGDREKLKEICLEEMEKQGLSEWIPDTAFSSQDSFFYDNGKRYGKTTIRRWV